MGKVIYFETGPGGRGDRLRMIVGANRCSHHIQMWRCEKCCVMEFDQALATAAEFGAGTAQAQIEAQAETIKGKRIQIDGHIDTIKNVRASLDRERGALLEHAETIRVLEERIAGNEAKYNQDLMLLGREYSESRGELLRAAGVEGEDSHYMKHPKAVEYLTLQRLRVEGSHDRAHRLAMIMQRVACRLDTFEDTLDGLKAGTLAEDLRRGLTLNETDEAIREVAERPIGKVPELAAPFEGGDEEEGPFALYDAVAQFRKDHPEAAKMGESFFNLAATAPGVVDPIQDALQELFDDFGFGDSWYEIRERLDYTEHDGTSETHPRMIRYGEIVDRLRNVAFGTPGKVQAGEPGE